MFPLRLCLRWILIELTENGYLVWELILRQFCKRNVLGIILKKLNIYLNFSFFNSHQGALFFYFFHISFVLLAFSVHFFENRITISVKISLRIVLEQQIDKNFREFVIILCLTLLIWFLNFFRQIEWNIGVINFICIVFLWLGHKYHLCVISSLFMSLLACFFKMSLHFFWFFKTMKDKLEWF